MENDYDDYHKFTCLYSFNQTTTKIDSRRNILFLWYRQMEVKHVYYDRKYD